MRACIATSIAISTVRKIAEAGSSTDAAAKFKVEIPVTGKGYHDWWVVAKLITLG